jgi:hypothetical protein
VGYVNSGTHAVQLVEIAVIRTNTTARSSMLSRYITFTHPYSTLDTATAEYCTVYANHLALSGTFQIAKTTNDEKLILEARAIAHARSRNRSVEKLINRMKNIPRTGEMELSWLSLDSEKRFRLCSQRRKEAVFALELKKRLSQSRTSQTRLVPKILLITVA